MGFSNKLINWYQENKRDLPWRNTNDAYIIWLSEIILQQTRVDQGLAYFNNFIEKFPTVKSLASASEKKVLNLWQGLGYYSRARNLHYTAKLICDKYNGSFPKNYDEILQLKGIGEYTAAAISSFSFNLCYPAIDGNVYRVLSRVFGVKDAIDSGKGKKIFKKLAKELIDKKNPGIYNQAIMEFGALQCKPKSPDCDSCPFILECYAYKNNLIHLLPVKDKKIKQRNRYFNYLVFIENERIYLKQRSEKDIWIGLYDFPLIETTQSIDTFEKLNPSNQNNYTLKEKSNEYLHILSHQRIHATFWLITGKPTHNQGNNLIKCELEEINNYPVPKLIDNYLKTIV